MSVAAGPKLETDGLVLALDASNLRSFDGEDATTTWTDISKRAGSGRKNGTINEREEFIKATDRRRKRSFELDGSNDDMTFPNVMEIGTGPFTMQFKLRTNFTTGFQYILSNKDNFDGPFTKLGFDNTGKLRFYTEESGGSNSVFVTDTVYANGEFINVTFTRTGATGKIYVNGVLVKTGATKSGGIGNSTDSWTIGSGSSSSTQPFKGQIASVRVYDRELSANEIARNFNSFKNDDFIIPPYSAAILLVGGGGGGGGSFRRGAGGGGAGGGVTKKWTTSASTPSDWTGELTPGELYNITIGTGGTGGTQADRNPAQIGDSGDITSISTGGSTLYNAIGGGGGGGGSNTSSGQTPGQTPGGGAGVGTSSGVVLTSGSANATYGISAGGFAFGAGSRAGGGGGGQTPADSADGRIIDFILYGGNGADGLSTDISGSTVVYGSGGGGGVGGNGIGPNGRNWVVGTGGSGAGSGGSWQYQVAASTDGTGGGGGGGGHFKNGGDGADGVAIIRVLTSDYSGTTTGSPTISTDGDQTILVYTSDGTYTA